MISGGHLTSICQSCLPFPDHSPLAYRRPNTPDNPRGGEKVMPEIPLQMVMTAKSDKIEVILIQAKPLRVRRPRRGLLINSLQCNQQLFAVAGCESGDRLGRHKGLNLVGDNFTVFVCIHAVEDPLVDGHDFVEGEATIAVHVRNCEHNLHYLPAHGHHR